MQNPSTAQLPYVETAPFQTFGKPRNVVVSFNTTSPEYVNYFKERPENNPPPPPSISAVTHLRLRRNSGGGFEHVLTQAFNAFATTTNQFYVPADAFDPNLPGGGWQQRFTFDCAGSFTHTDPGSTQLGLIYEAAIVTQAIPQIARQTLALISTEDP